MNAYRHSQIGWVIILPMVAILGVTIGSVAFGPEGGRVVPWIVGAFIVVLSLFSTLTVTIAGDWLECRFGVGLIRRRIRLRADASGW